MTDILSPKYPKHYWGLSSEITFTNHGSYGAHPLPVQESLNYYFQEINQCPDAFFWFNFKEKLNQVRESIATFVKTNSENIVLVPNATFGVNSIFRSFPFARGQEIIVTNHNYGACHNVIEYIARKNNLKIVEVEIPFRGLSSEEIITKIEAKTSEKTSLCFIDHLASASSFLFPVKEIVQALKKRGILTFIDGAHAPGQIDLNLEDIDPAFYTGNLHKWAATPRGTAFLYISPEFHHLIEPAIISWGSSPSVRDESTTLAEKFSFFGTTDLAAFLAIPEAIKFLYNAYPGGFNSFLERNQNLALEALKFCQTYFNLPLQVPSGKKMFYSVELPFLIKPSLDLFLDKQVEKAFISKNLILSYALLRDYSLDACLQIINNKYILRISSYCYNSMKDYQNLCEACEDLITKQIK